jgi:Domain of unknown function (DUF5666)
MNTGSPHLDLAELLAEATGEAAGDTARAHLAACPTCRAEVTRWQAVASGVRHLVATAPPPPLLPAALTGAGLTQPAMPRDGRRRALTGRKPHKLLAAAAAAGVLAAAGVSYGAVTGLTGPSRQVPATNQNGNATSAGLTTVNGCTGLYATSGTLERLADTSLILKTANGRSVQVTTSSATKISREVTGSLSDIKDGTKVFVAGTNSNGTIAARNIGVGMAITITKPAAPKVPNLPGLGAGQPAPGKISVQLGLASGTVADASAGSFTVVEADGTRVPVTTSNSTTVITLASVTLSQLRTGAFTVAVGSTQPDGTLAATTIEQEAIPTGGPPQPTLPNGQHPPFPGARKTGNGISSLPKLGCLPSTIATAALLSTS